MPRPNINPSKEQRLLVRSLAACGIRQDEIARKVGVRSEKTLRKHFREELDNGATDANYSVAQSLYKEAIGGDTKAAMFWLRIRAGWKDRPAFEPGSIAPPPFIVAQDQGRQQQ
jgi:hypothetical protein